MRVPTFWKAWCASRSGRKIANNRIRALQLVFYCRVYGFVGVVIKNDFNGGLTLFKCRPLVQGDCGESPQ